jgi:hypothetical protein
MPSAMRAITSNLGSLPEVVGDQGWYSEATDADAIATRTIRLLGDVELRARPKVSAAKQAPRFS